MLLPLVDLDSEYLRLSTLGWTSSLSPDPQAVDDQMATYIAGCCARPASPPLVLDLRGVLRIQDHAFDARMPGTEATAKGVILGAERKVILVVAEDFVEEIERRLGRPGDRYRTAEVMLLCYGSAHCDREAALGAFSAARSLLERSLSNWVARSFRASVHQRRLPSTPLLANGYLDSRHILEDAQEYAWTCTALADAARSLLPTGEEFPYQAVRLLAVSLRASAFAAGVAALLGEYYVQTLSVIDHAGPRRRIFDRSAFREWGEGMDFILVADFVVGGSELRSAETLRRRQETSFTLCGVE